MIHYVCLKVHVQGLRRGSEVVMCIREEKEHMSGGRKKTLNGFIRQKVKDCSTLISQRFSEAGRKISIISGLAEFFHHLQPPAMPRT